MSDDAEARIRALEQDNMTLTATLNMCRMKLEETTANCRHLEEEKSEITKLEETLQAAQLDNVQMSDALHVKHTIIDSLSNTILDKETEIRDLMSSYEELLLSEENLIFDLEQDQETIMELENEIAILKNLQIPDLHVNVYFRMK